MVKKTTLVIAALLLTTCSVSFGAATLYTPTAGDAQYAWNSKYGPYGYTTGGSTMGIYLYMGAPYGNDYTVSIFEVPIAALAGQTITGATLEVDVSSGFDTGYYYGSAYLGWVDVGTTVVTGDVVADGIGPMGASGSFQIYNTGVISCPPGILSLDVLSYVQADIDADRAYSTFRLYGSRET